MIKDSLLYFDKIFLINLDSRPDRLEKVMIQLRELGVEELIERFSAIVPSNGDGRLGCMLSHLEIIKRAKSLNLKNILVLEDDVFFMNTESISNSISQLSSREWTVYYLGYNSHSPLYLEDSNLLNIKNCYSTHAIAYNSSIFELIIDSFERGEIKIIDVWLSKNIQNRFNCFGCYPIAATQLNDYSDIEKTNVNYDFIVRRFLENTKHLGKKKR